MTPINRKLGRTRSKMNVLNGRECRWLRVDLGVPAIRGWSARQCDFHCCLFNMRWPMDEGEG